MVFLGRPSAKEGKDAKQHNTWAFFVNAIGDKEDPIVIVKSVKLRCFKHLKDKMCPSKCNFFKCQSLDEHRYYD